METFDIPDSSSSQMLVVEGVLSSQLKRHQIYLSRSTALNENRVVYEPGAIVTITDHEGEVLQLTEVSDGVYETPEYAAEPGRTYKLYIKTENGSEYESASVPFTDGPDIANVYAAYGKNPRGNDKGVQVYLDTESPGSPGHYYRWNYIETYEVRAPFPSNWVWLGGTDLEFRIDGIDTCYVTDTLKNIILHNTFELEQDKVTAFTLRYIHESEYMLRHRYSILAQQFCLSEEAYQYWDNLRVISEEQGSLSDRQPGTIKGNIVSLTNPEETVLGYFDAAKVSEKRILFSAINFYYDGLKMPPPLRSDCFDIPPISFMQWELPVMMPRYESTMLIWEVAGMSPSITVSLMPKSCCDCRNLGPTDKPDFF